MSACTKVSQRNAQFEGPASEVFLVTATPVIHSGRYDFHFDADALLLGSQLNLFRSTAAVGLLQLRRGPGTAWVRCCRFLYRLYPNKVARDWFCH